MIRKPEAVQEMVIEPAAASEIFVIGRLLKRCDLPTAGLVDHWATTLVARHEYDIVGSVALELYGEYALLRSLAVDKEWRDLGLGKRLVGAGLALARQNGVSEIYLLTETAADFLLKLGFRPIERSQVAGAVMQSVEFTEACPNTAQAMWLPLGI